MRKKKTRQIPITTWGFYQSCKEILGPVFLQKLFKRSCRQIDRWSCDPLYSESSERNPLDRLITLLRALVDCGETAVAVAIVDHLAGVVGYYLSTNDATPDKDTLIDEMWDDQDALADVHRLIRDNAPGAEIRAAMGRLKGELDETLIMLTGGENE